ncbi:hypothetical protein WH367_15705 [Comamonas sp. MYb21]|uniref:hypothetical protein n=1 Tax=Comamonas sp. MYb21 TaxID=1848648 RepID=UPI0030AB2621
MKKINRISAWRPAIVASLLAVSCTATWAARSFTPQAGTWVISEELDGKPGRGLAIDVQGNAFFMQVFGYEKNGDATFYMATGQLDGDSITVPLMQYQGGRSFGSDARDAQELGSPGDVTVSFANGLQGTVQFPGEPARAIQRFEMRSEDYLSRYWEKGKTRYFQSTMLDASQNPQWFAGISVGKLTQDKQWKVWVSELRDYPGQTLDCTQVTGKDEYHCASTETQAPYDPHPFVQSMRLRIANVDLVGVAEVISQGVKQTYSLNGAAVGGDDRTGIAACPSWQDIYVGDISGCSAKQTPSSGTWLVRDEVTFKPGRGIAIDVQNGMALAQVFNYLPNGDATFHMGSGEFQGGKTSFGLNRYRGGRPLGGPSASAELAQAVGDLTLDFVVLESTAQSSSRIEGGIAFPDEVRKPMLRMAMEPGVLDARSLLGQWWLRFDAESGNQRVIEAITLSRVEGKYTLSADGAVRCWRSNPQFLPQGVCVWNRGGKVYRASLFQQAGNRGSYALQVRDRHGNLMGLGDVPLE